MECISDPSNPKFPSIPLVLSRKARQIQQLCDQIIFDSDPSILSTSFFEHVQLKIDCFSGDLKSAKAHYVRLS